MSNRIMYVNYVYPNYVYSVSVSVHVNFTFTDIIIASVSMDIFILLSLLASIEVLVQRLCTC